jgi:hypothetical protein
MNKQCTYPEHPNKVTHCEVGLSKSKSIILTDPEEDHDADSASPTDELLLRLYGLQSRSRVIAMAAWNKFDNTVAIVLVGR